ncbi:MAG: hypothetical protein ABEJ96_00335, partial [Thiohalorhabdaceae bacterium]
MASALLAIAAGCGGDGGSDSVDTANASSDLLTTVTVEATGGSDLQDVPVTFGQGFAQGALGSDRTVAALTESGTEVPLQVDRKATHDDGSLRHAVLTARLPEVLASGKPVTLNLRKGTGSLEGNSLALSDLLNSGFDAQIEVDLNGGDTYTASARGLLQKSSQTQKWLDGRLVTEWLTHGDLTDPKGNAHNNLHARFHVRAYSTDRVRVAVVLENGWTFEPAENITYDLSVQVDGTEVMNKQDIVHYNRARWRRVFWSGGEPPVHLAHVIGYLRDIGFVPNYDRTIGASDSTLDTIVDRFENRNGLMGRGLLRDFFGAGGAHEQIAPLPAWTIHYLNTQDPRAKRVMLGTAEQGGAFSMHYRDKATRQPVSINDYPGLTSQGWGGSPSKHPASCANGADCSSPLSFDKAHQPSNNFVPYLVT